MKEADVIARMFKQLDNAIMKPSQTFINIDGEFIDMLDKKNRKKLKLKGVVFKPKSIRLPYKISPEIKELFPDVLI
jgi:hypothetical protein